MSTPTIETRTAAPKPGTYFDVPMTDYLRWPLLSQSVLKEGRASMAHLKAAMDGERVKEQTDDMILGSALHCCFLEPAMMLQKVVLWDGGRRYGGKWDEFEAEHAGKAILTEGNYQNLLGMMTALRRHQVVRAWAGQIEATEVAAVGEVAGVRMKGRCDAITPEPLVDLKKVQSADPRLITKAVLTFGYHIQAYIYRKLFGRSRFMLICVEGTPPYDVVAYELAPSFIRQGEHDALDLLEQVRACQQSGLWPGRAADVVTLEPPEWLAGDDITID